jgi:hypothetical protein
VCSRISSNWAHIFMSFTVYFVSRKKFLNTCRPLYVSYPLFYHQAVGNKYSLLKITFVFSLSPLFMSPKYNVNVTIEGSCYIQKFLIFTTHFINFLHVDVASFFLLMPIHYKPVVRQLLGVHLLSL